MTGIAKLSTAKVRSILSSAVTYSQTIILARSVRRGDGLPTVAPPELRKLKIPAPEAENSSFGS